MNIRERDELKHPKIAIETTLALASYFQEASPWTIPNEAIIRVENAQGLTDYFRASHFIAVKPTPEGRGCYITLTGGVHIHTAPDIHPDNVVYVIAHVF